MAFERLIQFSITPEQCAEIVENVAVVKNLLIKFPELFGIRNLRHLAVLDKLPMAALLNLNGNCFSKLQDLLPDFNYELMTRGLYAVPNEKVMKLIASKNFQLDNPIGFIENVNRGFLKTALKSPSEESIEVVNLYTAWLFSLLLQFGPSPGSVL